MSSFWNLNFSICNENQEIFFCEIHFNVNIFKTLVETESKEKFCNTVKLEGVSFVKEVRPTVSLMAESLTKTSNIYYQLAFFFVQISAAIFVCNHEVVCSSCRYTMLWTGDRIIGEWIKIKNEFCVKGLVINEFSALKFISKKVDVQDNRRTQI